MDTRSDDASGGSIIQHGIGSYENSEKKVDDIAKQPTPSNN